MTEERFDTVVIGGGQSGLAAGYHLKRRGIDFVILDGNERVGDAWRQRWDSLLLFTPARYNGLPGMRFPAPASRFVAKDAMADFLEAYAKRFALPVRTRTRVDSLTREDGRYVVTAGDRRFVARNVIVAMANYQKPKVPPFARDLDPSIVQIHSHDYRNPSQLPSGDVLVVGVGNSGADIALEIARTHPTVLAGRESAAVPFRIESPIALLLLVRLVRFIGHHVLSIRTPMGRKARPHMLHQAAPLIRVKPKDLISAGIRRVGRIDGVREGKPIADGATLDVASVIWCTGYHSGFSWIELPVFAADGEPLHEAGVVPTSPGLYFVGLRFLYAATSDTITGMTRDAARVVRHLAGRGRTTSDARVPA
jgi:putative flavoprotein involved in K+ transport